MGTPKDFMTLFLFHFCLFCNLTQIEVTNPERLCYSNTERCYWMETGGWKNYNQARQFCLLHGGDLAVIETKELWDFVISRFQLNVSDEVTRIGLGDVNHEGVFRWMCRETLVYEVDVWAAGQPDGGRAENCVGINGNNKLRDYPCHNKMTNTLCSTKGQLNQQIGERHDVANFQAAGNTCLAEGKHLLVIKDEKKDDMLRNDISEDIWLGLKRVMVGGVFTWEDGAIITNNAWTNWLQLQPSHFPSHNCAIRNAGGRWSTKDCAEQYPFYCEKQEWICHNHTGRCFWWGNISDTWDEARTACQSECGDLAVMETEELWDFVQTEFQFNSLTWSGLTDKKVESVFRWLNEDVLHYNKWLSSEPNLGVIENCAVMFSNELLDYPCGGLEMHTPRTLCSTPATQCTNVKDGCGSVRQENKDVSLGDLHGQTSFSEARATCEREGKRLLTIQDQDKENQVNNHHRTSENIWIDLTDEVLETVFRWSDGYITTLANCRYDPSHPTAPIEPNGVEAENCAFRSTSGVWFDASCDSHYHFYCEEDVPDPTFLDGDFILQKGDRIDNDHIILTKLVSSKLGCAIHCHRNKMCQGFSFVGRQTCVMASQLTQIQGDRQLFLVYKKNKD